MPHCLIKSASNNGQGGAFDSHIQIVEKPHCLLCLSSVVEGKSLDCIARVNSYDRSQKSSGPQRRWLSRELP